VLSALHSIYMNKFNKKSLAIAAQMKKSQDAAVASTLATPVAGAAKPGAKNGGPVKAKRVIDAKAVEVPADDPADDGADADDGPADVGTPSSPARNRPRRKKRRR